MEIKKNRLIYDKKKAKYQVGIFYVDFFKFLKGAIFFFFDSKWYIQLW